MTSPQSFADVKGDLGHEDATVPGTAVVVVVVVVVVANGFSVKGYRRCRF